MELPETLSESASDFAALPSLEPATRVGAYGGMEGGVGRLGHLGHKSLAQTKGETGIEEHMDTLSLIKGAKIYNGEKTISLTSGAGKTGQTLVEE